MAGFDPANLGVVVEIKIFRFLISSEFSHSDGLTVSATASDAGEDACPIILMDGEVKYRCHFQRTNGASRPGRAPPEAFRDFEFVP